MDNVCELLKQCRQLHVLKVTLRSMDDTPGSMEMLLDPLQNLRGVKSTKSLVLGVSGRYGILEAKEELSPVSQQDPIPT